MVDFAVRAALRASEAPERRRAVKRKGKMSDRRRDVREMER